MQFQLVCVAPHSCDVITNPDGMWNGEKKMLLWEIGDIDNSEHAPLTASFDHQGVKLVAGSVAVKFTIENALLSDCFAEVIDNDWNKLKIINRGVVSGKRNQYYVCSTCINILLIFR